MSLWSKLSLRRGQGPQGADGQQGDDDVEAGLIAGRRSGGKAAVDGLEQSPWQKAVLPVTETCASLTDVTAWRSLERLVYAFRFTQYVDVAVSFASLVVTWSLRNDPALETAQVQLPFLSMMLAVVGVVVPWLGIFASFRMGRKTMQAIVYYTIIVKLGFSSLLLFYLSGSSSDEAQTEVVMSVVRIALGVLIVVVGRATYVKLRRMQKERKSVMVIGLDGSGKSLLLDSFLPAKTSATSSQRDRKTYEIHPTAGLVMHDFLKLDSFWRVWDMSGNGRARAMWPFYFGFVNAVLFVVDASDLKRLGAVKREFEQVLAHPEIQRSTPLIFVCLNKTDLPERRNKQPNRISTSQLSALLNLDGLAPRFRVRVQTCSALASAGMEQVFQAIHDDA